MTTAKEILEMDNLTRNRIEAWLALYSQLPPEKVDFLLREAAEIIGAYHETLA